jgi:hypothetical protein
MAPMRPEARDPADTRRRISLTREQRDRIDTAAAALEAHAGHDEDPLTMLLAAADLRGVVGEWDVANEREVRRPRRTAAPAGAAPGRQRRVGGLGLDRAGRARRPQGHEQRPRRRRDGDPRRRDRRPRSGRAATEMTTHRRPDEPPSLLEQAVISALLRRPARYLRELLAEAERRGQPDLARLARQVIAWRAGQRG